MAEREVERERQQWDSCEHLEERRVLLSTGEAPATSFTQDGGTRMRCLEVRGLPFGRQDEETRGLIDRLNVDLQTHYGHAGPTFVRWLLQRRRDWERWVKQYRQTVEAYAERAKSPEAGRLAQYAAAIELAAALVHHALDLPWSYNDPLEALWTDIAAEADDASGEVRALRDAMSWAHAHQEAFYGRHLADSHGTPRPPAGGWARKWEQGKAWEYVAFFPTVLRSILQEEGYEPEAILAGWREKGWLKVTADDRKRYTKRVRVGDDTPHMVVIDRIAALLAEE